jgi:hypothetical protein
MWQQQMQLMESFHNDMILMVQMFVAMHREHLVSVREELDRVKQLTRELGVLQGKLNESSEVGAGAPSPSLGASALRSGPARSPHKARQDRAQGPTDPTQAAKKPRKNPSDAANRPEARPPLRPADGSRNALADEASSPADHTELHALLTKRITELQRERQGYWQKILGSIGK